jgi:iron-sulfur cluster insertion protein
MSILSENQSDAPADRVMNLTASAAARIAKLAALEGNPDQMLRLTVSGGGCSGFQYGFSFDTAVNEDDHLFARDNAKMVVDDTSLDLLAGAEVDYVEDLMGSYFKINNPNASSSCGCGASFSV